MDLLQFLRSAAALAFILGLIWVCAWALRRYGERATKLLSAGGKDTKRLRVVETTPLDARRKMVLIRRDDVEHLLLVDLNAVQVIETGIRPLNPTGTPL